MQDEDSVGCSIFVDLQKAFDTVDHKILLHKLKYYGNAGVYNDWSSLTYQIVDYLFPSMVVVPN